MSVYSSRSSLSAYRSVAAHSGVDAADPHRLITMLMDGALERMASARGAMDHGDIEAKSRLIQRSVAILDELRASLNLKSGGQIAANMADLYDYCGRQLVRANLENRAEVLDEVSKLLRELRGAWVQIPAAAR